MSGIGQYYEWNRAIPRVELIKTMSGIGQFQGWNRSIPYVEQANILAHFKSFF
jgi:hypothetical protein